MALGQRAEAAHQEEGAEAVRRADAYGAGDVGSRRREIGLRREHLRLDALGRDEEALALRRHAAAGGAALEELGAELFLERRHAAGNGRMVNAELARRGEELARARGGQEDADIVPIHRCTPFLHNDCAKLRLVPRSCKF